jgi:hypothetical protein
MKTPSVAYRQPARGASRPGHKPPSARANRVFTIMLYLSLAIGIACFLGLIYAILLGTGPAPMP